MIHPTRSLLGFTAVAILAACSTDIAAPTRSSNLAANSSVSTTGNGAPSGAHFTLNIIGVDKGKNANMDTGSGSVIFVGLGTKNTTVTTKIMLSQSFDGTFQVLDKNGTDGTASFQLPAPGTYTIWARALGKPGDSAKVTTCATDPATGLDICSTANEVFVRDTGKSTFRNVTANLTTIALDPILDSAIITACGGQTTVSLFDPCLEGYFWQYDNNGLRILQIRFYPT
jgi:hypothetical protein